MGMGSGGGGSPNNLAGLQRSDSDEKRCNLSLLMRRSQMLRSWTGQTPDVSQIRAL